MKFNFMTSKQIIFGSGELSKLGEMAKSFGNRAFLVMGGGSVDPSMVTEQLEQSGVLYEQFQVKHEPSIKIASMATEKAREAGCDFVIGFGGGSVIDTAKAVGAMLTNTGSLLDYLEVVGKNLPLKRPSAPIIAVPTTSGTGTEVTRNSVLSVPENRVKVSLRSALIIPDLALVDPELTLSMPPHITASSGMDAFTQLLESFVTKNTNPITDELALIGIKHISKSIEKAYQDGENLNAREDMALGSLLSGITLTNSGLGAVHGFAGPIGGLFDAPHGAICASLLPAVFRMNVKILRDQEQNNKLLGRYKKISQILTGDEDATIEDGIHWLEKLSQKMSIPELSSLGVNRKEFDLVIQKSMQSSSMKGNPVTLNENQLRLILEQAY